MTAWMRETLIVHRARSNTWRHWFRQHGLELRDPDRVMVLDSMFAVARAAEQGLGIALVPEMLARKWFESGALIQLAPGKLATGDAYYLSWQPQPGSTLDFDLFSTHVADTLTRD